MLAVKYSPNVHNRRSIRLKGFDYTQHRAYYVTICTYQRRCTLVDDDLTTIVESVWRTIAAASGPIDEFVVMPNHLHGILWITEKRDANHRQPVGAQQPRDVRPSQKGLPEVAAPLRRYAYEQRPVESGSLGALVRSFKSATAKRINRLRGTPGAPLWQRNYWEHVVRDEEDLNHRIRQYIRENPAKWTEDPLNPRARPRASHKPHYDAPPVGAKQHQQTQSSQDCEP